MNTPLSEEVLKVVKKWLKPPYDEKTQKEVQKLLDTDPHALKDAFHTQISFGTGGMRGVMGLGTNRLNRYTIGAASQGLANTILKKGGKKRLFISYDSRHHSYDFAKETAQVMAGNGITVYLTKELRPTPFVSFGCRYFECSAAVMITASHNPPEYNGYKVYWSDGAQVVAPHDNAIMEEVKAIKSPADVKRSSAEDRLITYVGEELDSAYLKALNLLQNYPKDNKEHGSSLKILYSPLHGAGITTTPQALKSWGFSSISYVEKQKHPDGKFPSVHSPNPEEETTLKLGIEQLLKEKGDLFLATDPDADRIGLVTMHQNSPITLNGNQVASICLYYLCQSWIHLEKMPKNGACVTTIVTTPLFKKIAAFFNITCFEVLTGFKYIGEKIHQWEQKSPPSHTFIFGAEESLGYLYGTHARDKDATAAACLIAEIALQQKKAGKTLVDFLYEIYEQFGLFKEKQLSVSFGSSALASSQMNTLMESLRKNPPKKILDYDVKTIKDYLSLLETDCETNEKKPLSLPQSNVLSFTLQDTSELIIRPSGTEPKIKIYGMVNKKTFSSVEKGLKECDQRLGQLLNAMKERHFSKM